MIDVCPEALAGTRVELLFDGEDLICCRCGATREIVMATDRMVQKDWAAGGPGYRKPRAGERVDHHG